MWFWLQILSVSLWAVVNVLDSLLVRRYARSPVALMWNQSYFSVLFLSVIALMFSVSARWTLPLVAVGICGYVGDLVFFASLKRIDVSVTNIAWVLLSILLSVGGLIWFGETWKSSQFLGVLLIFLGIIVLSLWHRRLGGSAALFLLPLLAILYTPFYLVQKAALVAGDSIVPVFFWSLLGRELMSLLFPFFVPALTRQVLAALRESDVAFFIINALVIIFFFAATYLTTMAFLIGPVSLVAVVGNVQPFFVLFLAWVVWKLAPQFASRELLSPQAVWVKIVSFLVVFAGLALLAVPQ